MQPHHFLRLLIQSKGLRESDFAAHLGYPKDQGTINKFMNGGVQNPRGRWSKLAPKTLGFNALALFDPDVAEQEAQRLALVGVDPLSKVRPLPAPRRRTELDPGMLVLQVADLMRAYQPAERETAAALFAGAAKDPESATRIAAALRALLSKRDGTTG